MAGYYSILRFVNNPLSDESIALGLVVLTDGSARAADRGRSGKPAQALFRLSAVKVEFAKKLNPASAKLLTFSLDQLHRFFKQDLADQSYQLLTFPVQMQQAFIERLAQYNNGLLQFTEPTYIESDQLTTAFDRYFDRFIESNIPVKINADNQPDNRLKQRMQRDFYEPLRGTIDVDYTLRKRQLPALYFDYHLDGIGVNGAMYAVKAVDLNAAHHLDTIQRELSEFESVIDRLNRFARTHNIMGQAVYYLVVDPYEGDNKDRKELYDILRSTPQFKLVTSAKLGSITTQFRQKKVGKFSEKLFE